MHHFKLSTKLQEFNKVTFRISSYDSFPLMAARRGNPLEIKITAYISRMESTVSLNQPL